VPDCGSPITILQGPKTRASIEKAAALTVFHSDKKTGIVQVNFGKNKLNRKIIVSAPLQAEVDMLRI
jgi:hypothetical protein